MNVFRGLGIALLLLAVGCGGPSSDSSTAREKSLVIALAQNPSALDPVLSQDTATNDVLQQATECLVTYDETNTIVPLIAKEWKLSEDGRTYTFKLREDAKFSDGSPVTAKDVQWSLERACDPRLASPIAMGYLGDIEGAEEKLQGKSDKLTGLQVIDDHTIAIRIKGRRSAFLGKLTYPIASVLKEGSVLDGSIITKPDQLVATGPFRITSYVPQQVVALEANPHALAKPKSSRLIFRIVKDPASRINLFKTGELHILGLGPQDLDAFNSNPELKDMVRTSSLPSVNYLGMNGKVYAPFADVRVRRAFVMAVDRDRLVQTLVKQGGKVADGILPPSIHQPVRDKQVPKFDPVEAKRLVQEAGFSKLPPIELWTSDNNNDRKAIAEMVVLQLKENLGVDAKVRLADPTTVIEKATKKQLPFFYGNWTADYLDAENFLSVLLSEYGQNRQDYHNPEFTRLCRMADEHPDQAKREELYAQAEDIAIRDCVWIPLYFPNDIQAVSKRVRGLRVNGFGFMPHTNAELLPENPEKQ